MSSIFRIEHDKGAQLWGYPGYRVVHAASGLRVTSRYTRAKAEAVVAWLESLPGVNWDFKNPNSKKAEAVIAAVKEAFHQGDKS